MVKFLLICLVTLIAQVLATAGGWTSVPKSNEHDLWKSVGYALSQTNLLPKQLVASNGPLFTWTIQASKMQIVDGINFDVTVLAKRKIAPYNCTEIHFLLWDEAGKNTVHVTSQKILSTTCPSSKGIPNPLQPIHIDPKVPNSGNQPNTNGWKDIYTISGEPLSAIQQALGRTNLLPHSNMAGMEGPMWTWSVLNAKSHAEDLATSYDVTIMARNKESPYNCTVVHFVLSSALHDRWITIQGQNVLSHACLLGATALPIDPNAVDAPNPSSVRPGGWMTQRVDNNPLLWNAVGSALFQTSMLPKSSKSGTEGPLFSWTIISAKSQVVDGINWDVTIRAQNKRSPYNCTTLQFMIYENPTNHGVTIKKQSLLLGGMCPKVSNGGLINAGGNTGITGGIPGIGGGIPGGWVGQQITNDPPLWNAVGSALYQTSMLPRSSRSGTVGPLFSWTIISAKSQVVDGTNWDVTVRAQNKRAPYNCTTLQFMLYELPGATSVVIRKQTILFGGMCPAHQPTPVMHLAPTFNTMAPPRLRAEEEDTTVKMF